MRSFAKFVYPGIAILGFIAVLAWFFSFIAPDRVPMDQLEKELGQRTLTAQDEELLNEFALHCEKSKHQQAAAVILNQPFRFRSLFQKGLQHALFSKLTQDLVNANESFEIAAAIARVYQDSLADNFLMNELYFSKLLTTAQLQRKLEADYFFNKGIASLSQNDSAMYYFKKSLHLSRKIGDEKRKADNLLMWQYVLYQKGAYEDALKIGEELLEIVRRTGYLHREAGALYNIGQIYIESGEVRKALECFNRAWEIHRTIGNQAGELQLLGRLGVANNQMGDFPRALDFLDQAITLCQASGNKWEELKNLNDRGLVFKNIGDYEKAKREYTNAFERAEEEKDYPNQAVILNNLGILYRLLGDSEQSSSYLSRALAINDSLGNPYDIALTLKNLGDVYKDQDSLKLALAYLEQARSIIKKNAATETFKPRILESDILINMGDIEAGQNNHSTALGYYETALTTFKTIGFKTGIASALIRIGNTLAEMGQHENALKNLNEALAIANAIETPLHQVHALYGIGLVYQRTTDFDLAEKYFEQAIAQVEAARVHIQREDRISYFSTIQNLFDQMIILQCMRGNGHAAFAYSERARARGFLDILRERSNDAYTVSSKSDHPASLEGIQNSLNQDVVLLEYRVTQDRLIIFAVDHKNLLIKDVAISRADLSRLVEAFRGTVEKTDPDSYARYLELAQRLYEIVIAPIKQGISPEKNVYVIPDGVLYQVPFAALVFTQDGQQKFLMQEYNLAYAPSAAILKLCLDNRRPTIPANQMKLFALGNPTGDLRHSATEVRDIARMFFNPDTLIGKNIPEDKISRMLQENINILHFATHASINGKSPLASYLVVGAENGKAPHHQSRTDHDDDGRLSAYEVYDLNLAEAQLVTLSACSTANGRFFQGEGVVGLTHAFMKAGTNAIIATQWNIPDKYTMELMKSFYHNWITKKMTKTEALREAQQKIIIEMSRKSATQNLPYPKAWAAITLTGDYR